MLAGHHINVRHVNTRFYTSVKVTVKSSLSSIVSHKTDINVRSRKNVCGWEKHPHINICSGFNVRNQAKYGINSAGRTLTVLNISKTDINGAGNISPTPLMLLCGTYFTSGKIGCTISD